MNNLDSNQKEAVQAKGNILLIAGAGSGKTFTILKKINYLIKNNIYQEKEILVISFTNKSVDDIKKKINYNVAVFTFHKLAINILDDYHFPFKIAPANYLEYIAKEFFYSLDNYSYQKEILKYYHEYDYNKFLKSYKFNSFVKTIITYLKLFKANQKNMADIKISWQIDPFITKYVLIINKIYSEELAATQYLDFDDLITKAIQILNKPYKYKYIIIDEFQDTSFLRWHLIYKLLKLNQANLFAVGDDFQSIYHFTGCKLNIFLNLKDYLPDLKILKLTNTYRNSQELIDIATIFILKNKQQQIKKIHSNKHIAKPINFIYYLNPQKALLILINKLKTKYNNILILGRNNNDINQFIKEKNILNNNINYLTIHKAKGLESECVIIINLINDINGLPNKIINPQIITKLHQPEDNYLYAEERRLFYVALTRSKNEVYLLVPIFHQSIFVKELKQIIKQI